MSTARFGTAELDERYGRTPKRRRTNRRLLWTLGATVAVLLIAWIAWGGLGGTVPTIDATSGGFTIIDGRTVEVSWQVTVPPGQAARCAIQAQNQAHAIVGWKIVDVPASDLRTRSFSDRVNTTELAVTGLIYRCWLA